MFQTKNIYFVAGLAVIMAAGAAGVLMHFDLAGSMPEAKAQAAGDTYYVTQNGAGARNGTSPANAWRVSQFNDPANWSSSPSASQIDPGDTVFIYGTITTSLVVQGAGTAGNPITIDGWYEDTCDPDVSTCSSSAYFTASIVIEEDYIIVKDGRFNSGGGRSIIVGNQGKVIGAEIRNSWFTGTGWSAIQLAFACDSVVDNNVYDGTTVSGHRFISINTGSRNIVTNNTINGGETCIAFVRGLYYIQAGEANDPDINYNCNEIAYNTCNSFAEEGITHDTNSSAAGTASREYDTVASINGNQITLTHAGWSGTSNKYIGYDMIAMPEDNSTFGNRGRIIAHSNATFTLDNYIANLEVGDPVVIGWTFTNNWIHHNTFNDGGAGCILLEGMSFNNLIEYNSLNYEGVGGNPPPSISIRHLNNFTKADDSVTQTYAACPNAFNIIRNNKAYGIYDQYKPKTYAADDGAPVRARYLGRNNAIYNNTELFYGIHLYYTHTYVNNNIQGVVNDHGSTELAIDPTFGLGIPVCGTPPPTCSNCCLSTQTCSSGAFSTVGTCTTCCPLGTCEDSAPTCNCNGTDYPVGCIPSMGPLYCDNIGNVIQNCQVCGCGNGWDCQPAGHCTAPSGGVHYVTQSGAGLRNGSSPANAWSVADFNGLSGIGYAGDTFYFSGTITSEIWPNISGIDGDYIILDGWTNGTCNPVANNGCPAAVKVDRDSGEWTHYTRVGINVYGDGQDYIIIQDFDFISGIRGITVCSGTNNSDHWIIRRNNFENLSSGGISFAGGYGDAYVTIGGARGDGNRIHNYADGDQGSASSGITFQNTNDMVVSYNHIYNDDSQSVLPNGPDALVVMRGRRLLMEYNTIYNMGEDGVDFKTDTPDCVDHTRDVIVRFNYIDTTLEAGIKLQGCQNENGYVYGNFVTNAGHSNGCGIMINRGFDYGYIWSNIVEEGYSAGICVSDGRSGDVYYDQDYSWILNNTLVRNVTQPEVYSRRKNTGLVGNDYAVIKNNILYYNQPGWDSYRYQIYYPDGPIGSMTVDYNLYYYTASLKPQVLSDTEIASADFFPYIINGQSFDANGLESDPVFTNFSNSDFSLQAASPAVNSGEAIPEPGSWSPPTIQGVDYSAILDFDLAIDPDNTDFTAIPPVVIMVDQDNYGSGWERGAYAYTGGGAPTCQSLGYNCCTSCQSGTAHPAYDDDCPSQVCCGTCFTSASCHQITPPYTLPDGYGAPWNVLSTSSEMLIETVCNTDSVDVSAGNGNPLTYIYRMGYIYKNSAWQSYDLTGANPITSDWYAQSVSANILMTPAELSGINYIVAYTCFWNGTEWKCGCRDASCAQNYWQLQIFGN